MKEYKKYKTIKRSTVVYMINDILNKFVKLYNSHGNDESIFLRLKDVSSYDLMVSVSNMKLVSNIIDENENEIRYNIKEILNN